MYVETTRVECAKTPVLGRFPSRGARQFIFAHSSGTVQIVTTQSSRRAFSCTNYRIGSVALQRVQPIGCLIAAKNAFGGNKGMRTLPLLCQWMGTVARSRLYLHFLLTFGMILATTGCYTSTSYGTGERYKQPLPKEEWFVGHWIGFTTDDVYFFRLRLDPGGTGLCARVFLDDQPSLLSVSRWTLIDRMILVDTVPLDGDTWALKMTGNELGGTGMQLKVKSDDVNKWERVIEFKKESWFLDAFDKSLRAMNR